MRCVHGLVAQRDGKLQFGARGGTANFSLLQPWWAGSSKSNKLKFVVLRLRLGKAVRFADKSFGLLECFFERLLVPLRVAVNGSIVDECRRAGFALTDVNVGVREAMLLEPFDDFDTELPRCDPRSFEYVLGASGGEDRDLRKLGELFHKLEGPGNGIAKMIHALPFIVFGKHAVEIDTNAASSRFRFRLARS